MVDAKGLATDVKFLINDTRMQLFLPKDLSANGGQIKLKLNIRSYLLIMALTVRGFRKLRTAKFIPLRNGTRACACMTT